MYRRVELIMLLNVSTLQKLINSNAIKNVFTYVNFDNSFGSLHRFIIIIIIII